MRAHVLVLMDQASCADVLPPLWSQHSSGVSAPPKNTLSQNRILKLALTLLLLLLLLPLVFSLQLNLFSDHIALSSSLPLCPRARSLLLLLLLLPSGKSVPGSVSRRASSGWLRLPLLNDFSPLSDLSLFPPPPSLVFRQLVLPLHRYSSFCATAPATEPEPLAEESVVSLCANFLLHLSAASSQTACSTVYFHL